MAQSTLAVQTVERVRREQVDSPVCRVHMHALKILQLGGHGGIPYITPLEIFGKCNLKLLIYIWQDVWHNDEGSSGQVLHSGNFLKFMLVNVLSE